MIDVEQQAELQHFTAQHPPGSHRHGDQACNPCSFPRQQICNADHATARSYDRPRLAPRRLLLRHIPLLAVRRNICTWSTSNTVASKSRSFGTSGKSPSEASMRLHACICLDSLTCHTSALGFLRCHTSGPAGPSCGGFTGQACASASPSSAGFVAHPSTSPSLSCAGFLALQRALLHICQDTCDRWPKLLTLPVFARQPSCLCSGHCIVCTLKAQKLKSSTHNIVRPVCRESCMQRSNLSEIWTVALAHQELLEVHVHVHRPCINQRLYPSWQEFVGPA